MKMKCRKKQREKKPKLNHSNVIREYIMLYTRKGTTHLFRVFFSSVVLVDVYKIVINSDAVALFNNETV